MKLLKRIGFFDNDTLIGGVAFFRLQTGRVQFPVKASRRRNPAPRKRCTAGEGKCARSRSGTSCLGCYGPWRRQHGGLRPGI